MDIFDWVFSHGMVAIIFFGTTLLIARICTDISYHTDRNLRGVLLYTSVIVVDLLGVALRTILVAGTLYFMIQSVSLTVAHWVLWSIAITIAGVPILLSLSTFFLEAAQFPFWLVWRECRKPAPSEHHKIATTLQSFQCHTVKLPKRWYIWEDIQGNAAVSGNTLLVSRDLLQTPSFRAILAHELGHINSLDSRLVLARQRLIIPSALWLVWWCASQRENTLSIGMGFPFLFLTWAFFFIGGGLGLYFLDNDWNMYWKEREYVADQYAADLGEAAGLIQALKELPSSSDDLSRLPWVRDTHPDTAQRIERL